jgi:hypothetical protein
MNSNCDVHELVRRFNKDEAVWRCFGRRRAFRYMFGSQRGLLEDILERLDWIAAERECREVRALGCSAQ